LPVDVLFEFTDPVSANAVGLRAMHDPADCVDGLLVDEELYFGQFALAPAGILVVESCVPLSAAASILI
jgi:hypothetical protein